MGKEGEKTIMERLIVLERDMKAMYECIPDVIAAACAIELPSLVGEPIDWKTLNNVKAPKWAREALKKTLPFLYTPAQVVRKKETTSWNEDERRWGKLDVILRPEKNQGINVAV